MDERQTNAQQPWWPRTKSSAHTIKQSREQHESSVKKISKNQPQVLPNQIKQRSGNFCLFAHRQRRGILLGVKLMRPRRGAKRVSSLARNESTSFEGGNSWGGSRWYSKGNWQKLPSTLMLGNWIIGASGGNSSSAARERPLIVAQQHKAPALDAYLSGALSKSDRRHLNFAQRTNSICASTLLPNWRSDNTKRAAAGAILQLVSQYLLISPSAPWVEPLGMWKSALIYFMVALFDWRHFYEIVRWSLVQLISEFVTSVSMQSSIIPDCNNFLNLIN